MIDWFAGLIQRSLRIPSVQTRRLLHITGVVAAAVAFILIATALIAYESFFPGVNNLASLQIGDIATQDIRSPASVSVYVSDVLTQQRIEEVRAGVEEIYFPPDPGVARQQTELVRQILYYIENVRQDAFSTPEQKTADLRQITDLALSDSVIAQILAMDDQTWNSVAEQVTSVLERVMRGEIRPSNLPAVLTQLPTQVSVRFTENQADVIVAIVRDLIRANTRPNTEATETARTAATEGIEVSRSFERGQIIVRAGERIDEAGYEALGRAGLLQIEDQRLQTIIRTLLSSIVTLVITGLYIARFKPSLFQSSRFMALLAGLFLIFLLGARISGSSGQFYLYPTAALSMLYVALVGPELAVMGVISLATLVAFMQNNSFESAMLVGAGGLMAALTLRRPERINSYFMPGLLVGLTNTAVVAIFFQGTVGDAVLSERIVYSLLNGILGAAVALGVMYIITLLFNLPTGLKLVELSQPNHPLLQRLLREAPGTYQHSLQVANLAEQGANAIGANADLVRVAALYHDVGKMMNAPFFTENQVEGVNPHDALNDPARSANIIISHVTDGEKLARQYRLPARLRDFIMEHHGTQVLYFYQQAVERAGSDEVVDIDQFTYPGPRPQSRETAVLMIADSCEAAVRSRKPNRKQDIADTVQQIFDTKIRAGQLDESGLTLNDIKTIRKIFIDMLQAVFHPRISYPTTQKETMVESRPVRQTVEAPVTAETSTPVDVRKSSDTLVSVNTQETQRVVLEAAEIPPVKVPYDDGEAPLPEVPPLPRTGDHKAVRLGNNGRLPGQDEMKDEQAG